MATTAAELRTEIIEHYEELGTYASYAWRELEWDLGGGVTLKSGRELAHVHQEGGEGEGDTYFYVFSTEDGEDKQLWRVDGYYASWDGVTYDDYGDIIKEVEAVIVPVTQYHRKM